MRKPGRNKRVLPVASVLLGTAALLAGCGVSVAAGGRNAATHPASGIFVLNTVGGRGAVSSRSFPTVTYQAPKSTPPAQLPAGLTSTLKSIESAVTGGCWQDSHEGNQYGAYDQVFWWMGACGDSLAGVTVELFPTAAAAKAQAQHSTSSALTARYLGGAVLVDVWTNAPVSVLAQLASVRGLSALPGYSA